MNKTTKNILIAIVLALLVLGIVWAVYNHYKAEPMDTNANIGNILDNANNGLENLINDIFNEENINNIEDEEKDEKNNTNTNTGTNQNKTSNKGQTTVENQLTPGEQKAVELAKAEWKKEWGNLNDVSFNNVMIQGDGKYVVSVNDSKTTKVICRYVIDTITGLVEER